MGKENGEDLTLGRGGRSLHVQSGGQSRVHFRRTFMSVLLSACVLNFTIREDTDKH